MPQVFSPTFSSRSLMVLPLLFRSCTHHEFIFLPDVGLRFIFRADNPFQCHRFGKALRCYYRRCVLGSWSLPPFLPPAARPFPSLWAIPLGVSGSPTFPSAVDPFGVSPPRTSYLYLQDGFGCTSVQHDQSLSSFWNTEKQ